MKKLFLSLLFLSFFTTITVADFYVPFFKSGDKAGKGLEEKATVQDDVKFKQRYCDDIISDYYAYESSLALPDLLDRNKLMDFLGKMTYYCTYSEGSRASETIKEIEELIKWLDKGERRRRRKAEEDSQYREWVNKNDPSY